MKFYTDKDKDDVLQKCVDNATATSARRGISLEYRGGISKVYHGIYDMETFFDVISKISVDIREKALKQFPVLENIFDKSGNIMIKPLFMKGMVGNYPNTAGGAANNAIGVELFNYIFNNTPIDYLKQKLNKKNYTHDDVRNFIYNLGELAHNDVYILRDLIKVPDEQFSGTYHQFNLDDKYKVYYYYFRRNALNLYKIIEANTVIKKNYLEFNVNSVDDYNWYSNYFTELFSYCTELDDNMLNDIGKICKLYDQSNNTFLKSLSNYIRSNIPNKKRKK